MCLSELLKSPSDLNRNFYQEYSEHTLGFPLFYLGYYLRFVDDIKIIMRGSKMSPIEAIYVVFAIGFFFLCRILRVFELF